MVSEQLIRDFRDKVDCGKHSYIQIPEHLVEKLVHR